MIRLGTGDDDLGRAAALLRGGELVAIPTETVYGLAADAANAGAIQRLFAAKGRPADHPLIVHLPDIDSLNTWVAEIPATARQLAQAFWPGPLTLILPRTRGVADMITGGQDTVGVRVPGHPIALRLLGRFARAVVAPSANRFGRISPTSADHVVAEFSDGDAVAAVVDGGPCPVGVESTIVDCSTARPRILRPGMIGIEQISRVLGMSPRVADPLEGPRASGRLASHYAPETRIELVDAVVLSRADSGAAVLALDSTTDPGEFRAWRSLPSDPAAYARGLYASLRALDAVGAERILVQRPPDGPGWAAVHDRLQRAAA